MFADYSTPQWVAVSFVFLGLALIIGMLVLKAVPALRRLHLPASVIAGFMILLLGPQVLGHYTGHALFPTAALNVVAMLPGMLINVVFAGIMLGKKLPKMKQVWNEAAPHVILGSTLSMGQFAIGAFAVALILTPVFGLNPTAGVLVEMSFSGGHGTIAGMGSLLTEAGAPELVDLGLGLATVSMVTGIVGGSMLVNYALRSKHIPVARKHTGQKTPPATSLQMVKPNSGDQVSGDLGGLGSVSRSFGAIALAIALAMGMLYGLQWILHLFGSTALDNFPLFPFTVVGSFIVQMFISARGYEHVVDRRTINDITGISLDLLIAAAIGTMSLAALTANLPSLVILTLLSVAWSVFAVLWLAPRIHPKNWFEHAITDYGQSQGNVAVGFILADMADPQHETAAARAYGYKQLMYEPLLGGGLITAFSVPLILSMGSLGFGILCALLTVALIAWGMLRKRRVSAMAKA